MEEYKKRKKMKMEEHVMNKKKLKEKIRGREVAKDNYVENFEEWKRKRKTE